MAGTPAREKENVVGTPAREKENMAGTLAKEKEYMVGTPTRKGLGFQQMYRVANLISKHERGENLVLHGLLHRKVRQCNKQCCCLELQNLCYC